MLTFSGPFTVIIKFIEAVGFEEIHEKKKLEVLKRERMGHCPFLVFCCDRELWPSVVTEKKKKFSIAIEIFGSGLRQEIPSRDSK